MKRCAKYFLFTLISIILVFGILTFIVAETGYGISLSKPYDKHLSVNIRGLSEKEIYKKDLKFIYEEIKDNYVNLPYKERTYSFSWDELYKRYERKADTIESEKEFYKICSEFISNLRDGHLSFEFANKEAASKVRNYKGGFSSAIDVRFIENKPIIVRTQTGQDIVGNEVVSINDVDFFEIVDTMKNYFYRGGNDISARTRILMNNYFYNYFSYFYDEYPDTLNIKLEDRNGMEKILTINTNRSFSPSITNVKNTINFGFNYNDEILPDYRIINNDFGYIDIPTFNGNVSNIDSEFEKAVKKFKEQGVKGAVIDIRYNSGGNQSFRDILGYLTDKKITINNYRFRDSKRFKEIYFLRPLYENIRSKSNKLNLEAGYTKWWSWEVKPNKEQFLTTIPVVVLTNESIFSSADSFVNICLTQKLATVIGNMVPLSGNGLPTPVLLPSKKYILRYGFHENREIDYSYMENVVKQPDIKVSQTLDDYFIGIDTQLKEAIEYIDSNKSVNEP
jgi:hypothetical protein